ncbi:hypothetical protein J6590_012533 [Homalodisca vitripennis]|nr:hypothetical protein J6590_012533 [Homalodisca vitripennis]
MVRPVIVVRVLVRVRCFPVSVQHVLSVNGAPGHRGACPCQGTMFPGQRATCLVSEWCARSSWCVSLSGYDVSRNDEDESSAYCEQADLIMWVTELPVCGEHCHRHATPPSLILQLKLRSSSLGRKLHPSIKHLRFVKIWESPRHTSRGFLRLTFLPF